MIKEQPKNKFNDFKQTYKTCLRLLSLLWQVDKKIFIGSFAFASIPAIIPFVNAYIYKIIIDLVIDAVNGITFDQRLFILLISARIITLFLSDASFSAQGYFDKLLWTKFPTHLYKIVLEKLSQLDVAYFEDSEFKNRLEKVKESYQWKPISMLSSVFYLFQSLLQLGIALFAIATLNWVLIIVVLIVAIPTFISQSAQAKFTWGIWDDNSPNRKKFWYLSDLIQDGKSVKEIKIFETASRFLSDLDDIYKKLVKGNVTAAQKQLWLNLLLNALNTIVYIATEMYIIFSAIAKRISIGDITYYTAVVTNFQTGVQGLFQYATRVFDNSLYVSEMFALLDTQPRIIVPKHGVKVDTNAPHKIEFKNVSFSYPGAKRKTLDNFSLIIEPGQKIAFVGENGAGKTTLVKLLARFYDVDNGEILIDGINIKKLDISSWYKSLGVLFQDFIKYEYSLKDNIYFGKVFEPANMDAIRKASEMSGASAVARKLPHHYRQMLGKTFEGGMDLSTGQWQKVALARGFLRDAPVLILDEPTAAIDAKAENEIFNKVEHLSKDKTVIIISHRFSTVRNADKIYVIDKGKIKEEGSHQELLAQNGTYAELFTLQAKGYQ
jgi:ATP-binding cassette, subfamily B, bacterial